MEYKVYGKSFSMSTESQQNISPIKWLIECEKINTKFTHVSLVYLDDFNKKV